MIVLFELGLFTLVTLRVCRSVRRAPELDILMRTSTLAVECVFATRWETASESNYQACSTTFGMSETDRGCGSGARGDAFRPILALRHLLPGVVRGSACGPLPDGRCFV